MPAEAAGLYDWIARYGFPGAMFAFIVMLYMGVILWRGEFERMKAWYEGRIVEMTKGYDARIAERDALIVAEREEHARRQAEIAEERDRFLEMVIGGQRNLSKNQDALSEIIMKVEPKPRR